MNTESGPYWLIRMRKTLDEMNMRGEIKGFGSIDLKMLTSGLVNPAPSSKARWCCPVCFCEVTFRRNIKMSSFFASISRLIFSTSLSISFCSSVGFQKGRRSHLGETAFLRQGEFSGPTQDCTAQQFFPFLDPTKTIIISIFYLVCVWYSVFFNF